MSMTSRGQQKAPGRGRTIILVDEGNLTGICGKLNRSIDWIQFRESLSAGRDVIETFVFAGLPPPTPDWADFRNKRERFLHWMEAEGFYVLRKQGRPTSPQVYKANVDVMMSVEAMELALEVRPETVILVSGDGDLAYLACRLRRRGIRVEVAAFADNLGEDLKISCNGLIDLAHIGGISEGRVHSERPGMAETWSDG
jgi:uncharacterized LabA/DUF88 family protein